MRTPRSFAALAVLATGVALASCAPAEEEDSAQDAATPAANTCTPDQLELVNDGQLTVGTDTPAYPPWFVDNDPSNGEGFESAVAYAVAEELGFSEDEVTWVTVPFNNSYKPGAKDFDFDINQISILPEREEVVDFSDGYYSASQAIIALEDTAGAGATGLADLADLRLGAQTGSTSLTAIREQIRPEADPLVFEDTNAAKQALLNDQVDAIVADLPTAFYISGAEIEDSVIVGQFEADAEAEEEFGMLFEKGNSLVNCVNKALGELRKDGILEQIETEWLSDTVDVPVLE